MAPEHAEDVALAQACARGEAEALARFEARFGPLMGATAQRFGDDDFAQDIAQQVRERLLVGLGGAPRIATYTGEGPLAGYVQAVTVRLALTSVRNRRPPPSVSDDALLDLPAHGFDPELEVIRRRYLAEFKQAFSVAMAALPADSRSALRLYYLDGLELADLGRLFGWSVPTASRRLAQARRALLDGTRHCLGTTLGLALRDVDSVLRLLESRLSIDALTTD
jgi:RNA polymerase sigma-70 factor (ECF subfamily)